MAFIICKGVAELRVGCSGGTATHQWWSDAESACPSFMGTRGSTYYSVSSMRCACSGFQRDRHGMKWHGRCWGDNTPLMVRCRTSLPHVLWAPVCLSTMACACGKGRTQEVDVIGIGQRKHWFSWRTIFFWIIVCAIVFLGVWTFVGVIPTWGPSLF